jgi:DNA-binding SARP family transcriptional activator
MQATQTKTSAQSIRAQQAKSLRQSARIHPTLRQSALGYPGNARLIELLRSSHGVPFFICAPRKTGRTSLAQDYARRAHRLDEVLWIDAAGDAFHEAIRTGTMLRHLDQQINESFVRFSLVVFDDLPALGDRMLACFSDWMDDLIEKGIEIIVITTPYDDCLVSHQSDRLLIEGSRLVASQKWDERRITESLNCFFGAVMPKEISTLAALMILMGRGIVDNLRELNYVIPASLPAQLKPYCPLIEIDENTGYFDAGKLPAARLRRSLLRELNGALRREEESEMSEMERCFERLTQLSVHLFERSEPERSQLLLEFAGSLLTHDDAGFPLAEVGGSVVFGTAEPSDSLPPSAIDNMAVTTDSFPAAVATSGDENVGLRDGAQVIFDSAYHPLVQLSGCAGRRREDARRHEEDLATRQLSSSEGEPEKLVVRLFGDFEIFKGGRRIEGEALQRSRVRSLMVHLTLNMGCGISRDALLEKIWPHKDSSHAKGNFHATWSRLNRLLSPDVKPNPYLTNNQGLCRLEPTLVTADIHEFEQLSKVFLFEQGSVEQRMDAIYRLEQLYRGDILAGYWVDSCVHAAQLRYRSILVDVMLEASQFFAREGNATNAVWFARKAYDADPTREDVYRVLMAMQSKAGQRTNALKTYFDCRRVLGEELGILPSQKTTALYQELILDQR